MKHDSGPTSAKMPIYPRKRDQNISAACAIALGAAKTRHGAYLVHASYDSVYHLAAKRPINDRSICYFEFSASADNLPATYLEHLQDSDNVPQPS